MTSAAAEPRSVRFGPGAEDAYDAWLPESGRADATVVLVHGGLWLAAYDRAHLRPLGGALARDGWPVASVEYARVGMPRGGWPGTGTSVLAALDAVAQDPVLPGRLVLVGHSAGGQLAVWAASNGRALGSVDLVGVISLAGVLDLRSADADDLGFGAVRGLLGGAPEQHPEQWADADPVRGRLDVPAVLLHGVDDDLVPAAISRSYLDSRGPRDASCRLEVIYGCEHFGLIDPMHAAYQRLLAALVELTGRGPVAGSR